LTTRLQAANVPCGRVRSLREAIEHPQVAARDILLTQTHAALGTVQTLAPVVKLSRTPADPSVPPPGLGEHTAGVLAALGSKV
jgi:crotonobetainyl-CoA:carnitine CoA-transferase CaiB-like acyl-CoA transferase